jgi:hypothetical protein
VTALRARINSGDEVSIGSPIAGASAWVLDESLQEVRTVRRASCVSAASAPAAITVVPSSRRGGSPAPDA